MKGVSLHCVGPNGAKPQSEEKIGLATKRVSQVGTEMSTDSKDNKLKKNQAQ